MQDPSISNDSGTSASLYTRLQTLKKCFSGLVEVFPRIPFVVMIVSPLRPRHREPKVHIWKSQAFSMLETPIRHLFEPSNGAEHDERQTQHSSPKPPLTREEILALCREVGFDLSSDATAPVGDDSGVSVSGSSF